MGLSFQTEPHAKHRLNYAPGTVRTSDIHKRAVTSGKLAVGAVRSNQIADGAVGSRQIGASAVGFLEPRVPGLYPHPRLRLARDGACFAEEC